MPRRSWVSSRVFRFSGRVSISLASLTILLPASFILTLVVSARYIIGSVVIGTLQDHVVIASILLWSPRSNKKVVFPLSAGRISLFCCSSCTVWCSSYDRFFLGGRNILSSHTDGSFHWDFHRFSYFRL